MLLCVDVIAYKARHKNRVKAKCKAEAWQSKAKVDVSYDEYDGGVRKHNGIVWAYGTSNINYSQNIMEDKQIIDGIL